MVFPSPGFGLVIGKRRDNGSVRAKKNKNPGRFPFAAVMLDLLLDFQRVF
jgi:hypothetical protein